MQQFLEKLRAGRKVVIVALGDSITALTWHTRGRLSWYGCLQEALCETYGRNRCWVIDSGCAGENAVQGAARLDEDVFRFRPDLVIVSYGMNDSGNRRGLPAFRAALCEIVDRAREHGADCLLRTPNPIVNPPCTQMMAAGQMPAVEMSGSLVGEFAREIVAVAALKQCAVADHYTEWKKLEPLQGRKREDPNHLWLRMSDPVHPGPLGHLAFFREMAPLFGVPRYFPWEAEGQTVEQNQANAS